ncbi:MAG TPA: alanine racemase, partial [Terrimesophilobacter sp.]|nr:alanine racemase [Terrimesophilobacter sp.]
MNTLGDSGISRRWDDIRADIADAARVAGREASELTIVVVTKFHPASLVRELAALGAHDFGENRHQEAEAKAAETADLDIVWHFVGQLQSKKVRAVRRYASVVHSLDRSSLLQAFARASDDGLGRTECLIQVNLTDDPGRGGVQESELASFADAAADTAGVLVRGVMGVAGLGAEPRREFARLRAASDVVRSIVPDATWISGGMSGD